jgi:MATE family multidrug resistance protein
MHAATYGMVVGVVVNCAANYVLVWHPATRIGFIGSPIAMVIGYYTMFLALLLYVCKVQGFEHWGGWNKRAWAGWATFLKLGG